MVEKKYTQHPKTVVNKMKAKKIRSGLYQINTSVNGCSISFDIEQNDGDYDYMPLNSWVISETVGNNTEVWCFSAFRTLRDAKSAIVDYLKNEFKN